MWNSRDQTLTGLAMSSKDMPSLVDVYQLLQSPKNVAQTSCIFQFLWHHLTSSFHLVGPYFTCADYVDSEFILTCVLETTKLFQHHGLRTSSLVSVGCAANLSAIKATHEHCGAYSILDDTSTHNVYQSLFTTWFCILDDMPHTPGTVHICVMCFLYS